MFCQPSTWLLRKPALLIFIPLLMLYSSPAMSEDTDKKTDGPPQIHQLAKPRTLTPGAPRYSDVGMRLFSMRNPKYTERMIQAGKNFHITRGEWSYIENKEFIERVHKIGWSFQGTTCAVTRIAEHAMRNKKGGPMLDHFQRKGRYWADMKNPEYRKWYIEKLLKWVELGVDSIQRDEPTTCKRTPGDISAAFHRDMHAEFAKKSSRKIPFSCNLQISGGRINSNYLKCFQHFDFGMAEFYKKYMDPHFFPRTERTARSLKKSLAFTGGDHRMNMSDLRLAIASCYSNGLTFLVPWDQFTGINIPRLFAKPEELADLYGFIRACPSYLEKYEAAVQVLSPTEQQRRTVANSLLAGRGFTVIMVSKSSDGGFGLGGNGTNGCGGIPRLYMTRHNFSYNILSGAAGTTKSDAVEITTFVHNGKDGTAIYTNGQKAGEKSDPQLKPVKSFGGGCLSIPIQGGNKNHAGILGEFMAFDRPLTDDEHNQVTTYLKEKYLDTKKEATMPDNPEIKKSLKLWFKADSLTGKVKDGQPVKDWHAETDHLALADRVRLPDKTQSNPPTFREKALNGLPAVEFDGKDDFMLVEGRPAEIWNGPVGITGSLAAYARAIPKDENAPVVIHLVEWSRPAPSDVLLKTPWFFNNRKLAVSLLTPVAYDKTVHDAAEKKAEQMIKPGERSGPQQAQAYAPLVKAVELTTRIEGNITRVTVPALNPWGILVITPAK